MHNFNISNYTSSFKRKTSSSAMHREYKILHILEFDPSRKRMSIIVCDLKSPNNNLLFCKGADSAIFEKSTCQTAHLYEPSLKAFSENGWRTLVLAYKNLNPEEYNQCKSLLDEANSDILNRESSLAKAYDKIESGLSIIGVTAVEDKLQENVESTLSSLRKAGIKIWVLTGDKLETAVNISESCKHFSTDMTKLILRDLNDVEVIKSKFEEIKER